MRDPLANPQPLIRSVYAYAAFRLGPGADAEDVTGNVFERAVRYRGSFDPGRGTPISWLIGIARHCVDDTLRRSPSAPLHDQLAGADDLAADAVQRLGLEAALARLEPRERELLGLRFVVGLSAKEVAAALELTPGAVDVAVHRARGRLGAELTRGAEGGRASGPSPRAAASRV